MDRQQILSVMETDTSKSLAAFNAAAADLMNATYIIVSRKISKLLQSVAQSRPLYEFLAGETKGYNFVEDFRSRQFRDENGRPYIAVPKEPDKQLKFAFCLLFAIDTGKLNIENLLHTFYYNSDANTELRSFCAEIVRPFAENLNMVMTSPPAPRMSEPSEGELNIDLSGVQNFAPTDAEQLAAPQPKLAAAQSDLQPVAALPETKSEQTVEQSAPAAELSESHAALINVVSEIVDVISHDITLSILAREELLLVCDAFNTAVSLGDAKPIRLMYIALKYTLMSCSIFPELESKYEEMRKYTEEIGIYA